MFFLVWRGLGFFVPLSFAVACVIVIAFSGESNYDNFFLFLLTALFCLVSGILIKRYRRSTCERNVIDFGNGKEKEVLVLKIANKTTGETYTVVVKDTFFGIDVVYWSIINAVLSVVYYVIHVGI
ncbi:MAG: hypothetical protein FWH20_11295 [Oscillospiraceae bacterium]|nr:hypothetical protein [Oscillospiraceae bacterium]